MSRRRLAGAVLISAALLISGCSSAAEQVAESASGADVDINGDSMTITSDDGSVTVEEGGDTVTYEGEDGTTVVSGAGADLPATYPADMPVPSGVEVVSALENGEGVAVIWNAEGLTEEAFEAFIAEIRAAGYGEEVNSYGAPQPNGFTKAYDLRGKGLIVSVTGMGSEGTGQITLATTVE